MCGFVAYINCGDKESLQNAVGLITHRGPDDKGIEWFNETHSGLAHHRLSIIDLSPGGHQPMKHEDGKHWIVYNGEIYNYLDLRKELTTQGVHFRSNSDTEIILNAYLYWGSNFLERLNGMFSLLIFNSRNGEIFCARDRLGIKPFYYTQVGEGIIVASEIKSILASGIYKKEPDYAALHTPVHYQTSPFTGFRGIYKLPPGNQLSFNTKEIKIQAYWKLDVRQNPVPESFAVEELDHLINDAVRLQMIADVPVGVLLSGGLDSSVIAALMQKQTNRQIHSFTIKFSTEDLRHQGNVNDSYYANKLATQMNFNHHEILIHPDIINLLPKMIWHLDEPLSDPAAINTYLICKAAREKGIIVLLNGMGADEVFSGYRAHLACLKAEMYQKIMPGFLQFLLLRVAKKIPEATTRKNLKYIRWIKSFLEVASLPQMERSILIKNSALSRQTYNSLFTSTPGPYNELHHFRLESRLFKSLDSDYLTHICYNDTMIYMPDHNLTYTDKASMAASVECRPPLIDHRIVEFMFRCGLHFRIKKNTQKYILKKVAERYIPKENIYRPKAPFSAPMRGWLKNELSEMVHDILSVDSLKKRGIYRPEFVTTLIENNKKGIEDNSQLIFRLLCSELWFRTFFPSN
jgi:asparagine synthase (glutamine-hydrolysing)